MQQSGPLSRSSQILISNSVRASPSGPWEAALYQRGEQEAWWEDLKTCVNQGKIWLLLMKPLWFALEFSFLY